MMKFARWIFRIAGAYGLIVLIPQYFMERQTGADNPAGLTHPEFFYGFLGVAIAWQVAFFIIAADPVRYRALMLPSVLEKFSFAAAATMLFIQHRLPATLFAAGLVDLTFGVLFLIAWRQTAEH
jgi:hypothetical protein